MQQLTGLDELYLSLDTGPTNGHVGGLALFPARSEPRDELAFLRQRIEERLPKLPPLRWRLKQVPMRIDHQYWVDGPVDIRDHVGRVRLARPGGYAELTSQVQVLMNSLLPRDRPMWRMWVIEGLEDGGFAYLLKLSHGVVDGSMLWSVFDQLSDAPREQLADVPTAQSLPNPPQMLARGLRGNLIRPAKALKLQAEAAKWAIGQTRREGAKAGVSAVARLLPGELARPAAWLANRGHTDGPKVAPLLPTLLPPKSGLNGKVTDQLAIEWVDFAISDLRAIGKIVGGTINDAALAVVAATTRRYLQKHGGLPDRPLIAATPISWRTGQEKERWANQVFMLFQPIASHLADPMDRLQFAHDTAVTAKANWDGIPSHLLRRASSFLPTPAMRPMYAAMAAMPGSITPKVFNLSFTNIKGPQARPSFGGTTMHSYLIFGFLAPGIGMLLGGQSLGDRMIISATVCQDIVPDHSQLPRMLQESLEELLALVPAR